MTELFLAAPPPAPESSTNYIEVIGIPLLVAVVTAAITSWLSGRRSAADRVAELRLKAYTDAVVAATNYMRLAGAIKSGELESGEITKGFVHLYERLQVLSIVASKRAIKSIDGALEKIDVAGKVPDEITLEEALAAADLMDDEAWGLVEVLLEESRRDVRRARV
ncbi:hypothetical protein [Brachybacterium paraconglomeratum]|uniref:hypothetical protein n=1 Tax=Brachybacterium paraconglomeratum TaxID=173362 RepID=UPI0024909733|nr:hypothetical protein [Brachybacterium paraconglomeratum]